MSKKESTGSKVTRRKFLETSLKVGLGAAGVALTGAACATEGEPALTATPQAAAPTPQPATPTVTQAQPAVIEFWQIASGPNFQEVMAEAIKDFEDSHPNIRVNLNEQPTNDIRTKVRPIFTDGGPGPDVLMEGAVQTLTYAQMPYGFIDITDRIEAAGIKDKTPSAPWAPVQDGERVFGLPYKAFPFFLMYNKDLYADAGITSPPETWEELSQVVTQMHDPANDVHGFLTFADRFVSWLLETLWYDSGIGYFEGSEDFRNFDISRPLTIAEPEAVAALEYLRSLAETAPGGIEGNFNIGTGDADAMFAQGNIGHLFTHTTHISQIPDHNPSMTPQENFDVIVFPKGPERRGVSFSSSVFGITELSEDPDAAWEFVKFLSDNWEGYLAPSVGQVPLRQDVEVDENAVGSWLVPIGREALADDAFPQAFFPQLDTVRLPLADNVQAYFLDQKTAEEALQDTVAAVNQELGS